MKINTVTTYDKNHVAIQNKDRDISIHVTRVANRAVAFTEYDHKLCVMYVSRDYGEDEEALYEKYLHLTAKMSMKDKDTKYYTRCESLHFNNGAGTSLVLSSAERKVISDHCWALLEKSKEEQDEVLS